MRERIPFRSIFALLVFCSSTSSFPLTKKNSNLNSFFFFRKNRRVSGRPLVEIAHMEIAR